MWCFLISTKSSQSSGGGITTKVEYATKSLLMVTTNTGKPGRHVNFSFASFSPPSFTKSVRGTMDYKGIQNVGATCYLNSYLQALYHIPGFRRAVCIRQLRTLCTQLGPQKQCRSLKSSKLPLGLCHRYKQRFAWFSNDCYRFTVSLLPSPNLNGGCACHCVDQKFWDGAWFWLGWKVRSSFWTCLTVFSEELMQHDIQEFSKKLIDVLERDMKDFLKSMLCGQIVTNLSWGVEGQERNVPEEFYGVFDTTSSRAYTNRYFLERQRMLHTQLCLRAVLRGRRVDGREPIRRRESKSGA